MTVLDSTSTAAVAPDPAEAVLARLDDPRVFDSLNQLLDHVDLLAVLVGGLDQMITRSDTISDSLAGAVDELRSVQSPGLDVGKLLELGQRFATMAPSLLDKLPVLEQLLGSDLGDPRLIDLASMASRAAVRGTAQAQAEQAKVGGVRALLRVLKDDDVSRALGFLVTVAKALGQELRAAEPKSAT